MNLYRVDLTSCAGNYRGAVSDLLGPTLFRSFARARVAAIAAAQEENTVAHVSRISGAGSIRHAGTVYNLSHTLSR